MTGFKDPDSILQMPCLQMTAAPVSSQLVSSPSTRPRPTPTPDTVVVDVGGGKYSVLAAAGPGTRSKMRKPNQYWYQLSHTNNGYTDTIVIISDGGSIFGFLHVRVWYLFFSPF